MTGRTPGEWRVRTGRYIWAYPLDGEEPAEIIAETMKAEDAEYIVRAVSNHEPMLAALELCISYMELPGPDIGNRAHSAALSAIEAAKALP